jgi:hypothetical protein
MPGLFYGNDKIGTVINIGTVIPVHPTYDGASDN